MVALAAVTFLIAGRPDGARAGDAPVRHIDTHGEHVPDLAEHFTVINVRSGAWSDPATWDRGGLPEAGDTVRIAAGSRVEYDVVSDARLHAVGVAGTLAFRTSEDTRLRVTHLLVYAGGTLSVGDERNPVQPAVLSEIVINYEPLLTGTASEPDVDPFQHGNGLLVWGTLTLHGAARSPGFVPRHGA